MTDKATWGDFEVLFDQLLGRGGMGAVYRGRQISLDRPVAIKILDTSAAPDEEFARGFLEKFVAESRALAKVHDPRIITVYQAGKNDNKYWYAMELIDGKTVEDLLQRDGMFGEKAAARIACDVARALDAAWREGIVHRDVKPPNIFILRDGSAKLGDFGIARTLDLPPSRISEAHAIMGTPTYLSPEQGLGSACDNRSDIYSLGVVLYEMLTERPPLAGISAMDTVYKHANETPQPVRLYAPDVSQGMERIVMCCLEKAPADRFQTYAELIQALELVASGRTLTIPVPSPRAASAAPAPEPVPPPAVPVAVPPPPPRTGRLATLVALAVITIGAVIAFAWPKEREPLVVKHDAPPPSPPTPPPAAPPPPPVPPVELKRLPTIDEPTAVDPSPGREDTLESYLSGHAPSPGELQLIRAMWTLADEVRGDLNRLAFAYASFNQRADHTAYTRLLLRAAADAVESAAKRERAFQASLVSGRDVTIVTREGAAITGTLRTVSEKGVSIMPAGSEQALEIARAEIAAESAIAGLADPVEATRFRVMLGDPVAALRELTHGLADPDLLALVPAAVHAIAARAIRGANVATMESLDALLAETAGTAPANLAYAWEPAALLRHELEAWRTLRDGKLALVLEKFEGARAYPDAVKKILDDFLSREFAERIAGGQVEHWDFDPFEDDLATRQKHIYFDPDTKALAVDQLGGGARLLSRKDAGANRGLILELSFRPGQDTAVWALLLTDRGKPEWLQLDGTASGFTVHDKAYRFEADVAFRTLCIVPAGPYVLVYDGRALAAKARLPKDGKLESTLRLGVTSGLLKIRSLKVPTDQ